MPFVKIQQIFDWNTLFCMEKAICQGLFLIWRVFDNASFRGSKTVGRTILSAGGSFIVVGEENRHPMCGCSLFLSLCYIWSNSIN